MRPEKQTYPELTAEQEREFHSFCRNYVALLGMLYVDAELSEWCRQYSAHRPNTTHLGVEQMIYDKLLEEAYALDMPAILGKRPYSSYKFETALAGTRFDLVYGICMEIRRDYWSNGSLINDAIASGRLYRLMCAFLGIEPIEREDIASADVPANVQPEPRGNHRAENSHTAPYSLAYLKSLEGCKTERRPGGRSVWHDVSLHKWRMTIQLDENRVWFLSVSVDEDGTFDRYSLDEELAEDSHYEFTDEQAVRKALYRPGDENLEFAEVLVRYVKDCGGYALLSDIRPFITAEFHYH